MRPPIISSPDDIDFTVLAAAVKRGLGKLLLATGVAGLASIAVLPSVMPKHASQMQIEIVSKAHAAQLNSHRVAGAPHLPLAQSSDSALERAAKIGLAASREFNSALLELGPTPSGDQTSPSVDMIALVAMMATLLLGLAFVVTREVFVMAQKPTTSHRAARTQASIVTSAIHSLVPAAGRSMTRVHTMPSGGRRLAAEAQDRTGFRTPAVGDAAGIAADAMVVELAGRLARQGWPVSGSMRAPTAPSWDGGPVHRPRSASAARCQGAAPSRTASPGLPARKYPSPPPVRAWPVPPPPCRQDQRAIGGW